MSQFQLKNRWAQRSKKSLSRRQHLVANTGRRKRRRLHRQGPRQNKRKLCRRLRRPRRPKANRNTRKHLRRPHLLNRRLKLKLHLPLQQKRRYLRHLSILLQEKKGGRTCHFRLTKLRTTTAIHQKFAKSSTPGSR